MADTMDFAKVWGSNSPLAKYEFTNENYLMGWNFVGSVPPSRIMWDSWMRNADLKMKWLYNNAFSEDSLGGFLFWRLPNTAYFVNDLRCLQEGPINIYLKCTVAGMSSGENITKLPANKRVGEAWQDGTVTWEIMQFSSSADIGKAVSAVSAKLEKAVSDHNNNTNAHKDFTGATSSKMGTRGMVPAPAAGDEGKFLCADGTFKVAKMTTLELVNLLYPVGIIAEFTNDTDPNEIWPGTTWSKMDAGRVLVAAGSYSEGGQTYNYNLGDKGGEAKHPLTIEELVAHSHAVSISYANLQGSMTNTNNDSLTGGSYTGVSGIISKQTAWGHYGGPASGDGVTASININASHGHNASIGNSGGSGAHENRQPYTVVNRWKRTA